MFKYISNLFKASTNLYNEVVLYQCKKYRLCPACKHPRHNTECQVRSPWWRHWIIPCCRCTYWDSRWDEITEFHTRRISCNEN